MHYAAPGRKRESLSDERIYAGSCKAFCIASADTG